MKNFILFSFVVLIESCHHKNDPAPAPPSDSLSKLDTIYNPVDPLVAASVGFFLDDWQPKTFVAPTSTDVSATTTTATTDTINIDLNNVVTKIPKYIFGNNANQWMGQIVDQPSLMGYLKDLNPDV